MTDNLKIREDCTGCGGTGEQYAFSEVDQNGYGQGDIIKCPTCHGTRKVPIIYTPEKFVAAGHKLHDDVAVWALWEENDHVGPFWILMKYGEIDHSFRGDDGLIIATPAITREVLESL